MVFRDKKIFYNAYFCAVYYSKRHQMINKKPHILIVDDQDIALRGISQILIDAMGEDAVSIDTAKRGMDALKKASRQHYDIVLLGIEIPDMGGLELLHSFRMEHPDTKVIVNTMHEGLWYMKDYIKAEVAGILIKSANAKEISTAVKVVLAGGTFYCSRAKSLMRAIEAYEPPTPKEMETLRHLASGKNTEDIARFMGISTNTVESHRRHLLSKLDAKNVAELIMNAVMQGLLPVKNSGR